MLARRSTLVLTVAIALAAFGASQLTVGCEPPSEQPLSGDEARQALDETMASDRAMALTTETIEVTTSFTIGAGIEAAAEELRTFLDSQIPCSTVTLESNTLTVDYGSLGDQCVYHGKTYAGVHTITLVRNDLDSVEVSHSWQDMTDGTVTVSGAATVTWDATLLTRRVQHDLSWVGPGGQSVDASGDRLQRLVAPAQGIDGGVRIDGERQWVSDRGSWDLQIDGVEVRAQDPVPQLGTYTLTTANGKELALTFMRLDDDTIQVTMSGTRTERVFLVHRSGAVSE